MTTLSNIPRFRIPSGLLIRYRRADVCAELRRLAREQPELIERARDILRDPHEALEVCEEERRMAWLLLAELRRVEAERQAAGDPRPAA